MGINIAVIGNSGKDDAICWKLSNNENVENIYFIPGNAGAYYKKKVNQVKINPLKVDILKEFLEQKKIKLVFVDKEEYLFHGLTDILRNKGFIVIGVSKKASILESSKAFAKLFMQKYDIPTPEFIIFDNYEKAYNYISKLNKKYVIKVSGPANGKGSFIIDSKHNGIKTLQQIMINKEFGNSGNKIIIENYLKGEEVSLIVVTDSDSYKVLPLTHDYKKAFDYDLGLNTEGMGSISPYNIFTENEFEYIKKNIIEKTLENLKKENIEYNGFLYFGLIKTISDIYVLEYNTRLGDPETEAFLPLLKNNILEIFDKLINKKIKNLNLSFNSKKSVAVVIASKGYPISYEKDILITGINRLDNPDLLVFHNNTKLKNNKILTDGGRVITLVGLSSSISGAKNIVYKNINKIYFDGMFYRKDIGEKIWKFTKA